MTFDVNFDGTEARLPMVPGIYEAKIEKIEDRSGPNGEYWNLSLVVASGTFVNRRIFTNVTFGEKASWKLKNLLISTGLVEAGKKGRASFDSLPQLKNTLSGLTLHVKVEMGTYNDQPRPEVTNFVVKGTVYTAPPATQKEATAPPATQKEATASDISSTMTAAAEAINIANSSRPQL